jgi:hypothetical protein
VELRFADGARDKRVLFSADDAAEVVRQIELARRPAASRSETERLRVADVSAAPPIGVEEDAEVASAEPEPREGKRMKRKTRAG